MNIPPLLFRHSLVILLILGTGLTSKALPTAPQAEMQVGYTVGDIKADPSRNLVYLVDQTDNLILEIDTNLGMVLRYVVIEDGATTGKLAVSVDGSTLYLAESAEDKILTFSLPELNPGTAIPLNFSPSNIVAGAGGRLYASRTVSTTNTIVELNTSTGSILQTFGSTENYYYAPLLHTNAAGTNLYGGTLGLSGSLNIYKYAIGGATVSSATPYNYNSENMEEFSPDEDYNRIYNMSGGISGINVINTTNDDYSAVWAFTGAYGVAVAFPPGGTVVFGGSGDFYSGDVKMFSRADGAPITDNIVSGNAVPIKAGGLAATSNGRAIYVRQESGNAYIGIIGLAHISPVPVTPSLFFQHSTSLGILSLNSGFLPTAWQGVGAMNSGWQERAHADINGDGIPDILFQNGTLIGALILNASGAPTSWVGIGSMGTGWQLRGAANLTGTGNLDLIFQNGTLLGYLAVSTNGTPVSWNGIGAMGTGWQLRAVADISGDGQPDLLFQNGTALGALQVGTNGVPTAWNGIGTLNAGWTLSDAVDVNSDGQADLIFQDAAQLAALQVNTSFQPISWQGIGAMNSGWTQPGDY
jgi:hypothetical protein